MQQKENRKLKSKQPDSKSSGRRRLLSALTLGGGALAAKSLPERWTQPVVDSVVLPAHAQSSPGSGPSSPMFTCTVLGPDTIVAPGGTGDILMTISPAPGPGISIQARGECDGNLVFNVTPPPFDFTTGEAMVTIGPIPGPPTCNPGDELTVDLTATMLGLDATCTFDVIS